MTYVYMATQKENITLSATPNAISQTTVLYLTVKRSNNAPLSHILQHHNQLRRYEAWPREDPRNHWDAPQIQLQSFLGMLNFM